MHAGQEAIRTWLTKQGYATSYTPATGELKVATGLHATETVDIETMRDAIEFVEFVRRDV